MSNHEDKYLNYLLSNDQKGIKAIYDEYLPKIESILKPMGCSRDNAWEIFQESLIVILSKARKPDFKLTSSFYTYLVSVSKFKWYNLSKKKSNKELTIEEHNTLISGEDIEADIFQTERYRLYKAKMAELSPNCRQILELFFDQTSLKNIAEKLKLSSENSAKQKKFQCQKKLIALIQSDAKFKGLL
jgi:RNA polymerase sigma factor (sigma-70 family)